MGGNGNWTAVFSYAHPLVDVCVSMQYSTCTVCFGGGVIGYPLKVNIGLL